VPELPDVEVFRRRLQRDCLGRRVDRLRLPDPNLLRDVSSSRLGKALRGHTLSRTRRHGKHLFASIDDGAWLVLHFGMTGFLEWRPDSRREDPAHLRMVLQFADGSRMVYDDMRRLGFVSLTDDVAHYVTEHGLGPDALDVGYVDLRDTLRSRRGAVKAALMDQEAIAGIGNIYADEILFHARLHPRAPAARLEDASYRRLYRQTRRVLRLAADRGADPTKMPDTWLLPHRTDGTPCPRGNGTLRRIAMSGRGAFYCPQCQPLQAVR
jgi:formamidopyrimidine-DNA glycosylase